MNLCRHDGSDLLEDVLHHGRQSRVSSVDHKSNRVDVVDTLDGGNDFLDMFLILREPARVTEARGVDDAKLATFFKRNEAIESISSSSRYPFSLREDLEQKIQNIQYLSRARFPSLDPHDGSWDR